MQKKLLFRVIASAVSAVMAITAAMVPVGAQCFPFSSGSSGSSCGIPQNILDMIKNAKAYSVSNSSCAGQTDIVNSINKALKDCSSGNCDTNSSCDANSCDSKAAPACTAPKSNTPVKSKIVVKSKAKKIKTKTTKPTTNTTTTSTNTGTTANTGTSTNTSKGSAAPTTNTGTGAVSSSQYVNEVLRLVNVERAKEGLSPLTMNTKLNAAAAVRAAEIVKSFSHTRPDGRSCFTAVDEAGYTGYKALGENIAAGQKTPEAVVTAWMNSPGHRANIMSAKFTTLGVSYVNTSSGYGHYWAQMFAG